MSGLYHGELSRDRQRTYNAIFGRVRATNVAVEEQ